jgi:steroid 5-alpha reductase family enzyme
MARFGALLALLIAITGWMLSLGFTAEAERHAILVSAILAAAVQMTAFALVRITGRQNAILAGWGMGIVLRTITLVLYGLVFAKLLGLPLAAALTSFAVFLFASMLLESFLISYAR